jgi:TMEM175 potassium channel family protein
VSSENDRSEPPGEPPPSRWSLLSRAGHLEYDRVLFFSDAIFAIAITLLVLEIRVPAHPGNPASELHAALPHIFSFGISFVVIGLFWMGHHSLSRYIAAFDRGLIAINLLFLGLIAFLPYPTGVLNNRDTASLSWVSTAFYAACIAAAGLAELAIWRYAIGKDLLTAAATPALRREVTVRLLIAPVVFLLSIPLALYSPNLATYSWLLILVANHWVSRWSRTQRQAS